MEIIYLYVLIGLIGGVTAGMLGLGGGIIFVPGLLLVHKHYHYFTGYELQAAVFTSIICIIFAGFTSTYLHYKNQLIDVQIVKKFAIYVIIGCFFGIYILENTSSKLLENIYSIILIILALILISDAKVIKNNIKVIQKIGNIYFLSNGTISSLMGIGGGTLSVPYLSFIIGDIKHSIATASAIGLVIALSSMIFMYFLNSNIFINKINHISLFSIIPASVIGSYSGVYLLRVLNPIKVKNIFSTVLIVIAVYLFFE
tara:strand:- start:5119 stop:5889 length:771 start_codon:yes stop_codon:yes gene_type:complete